MEAPTLDELFEVAKLAGKYLHAGTATSHEKSREPVIVKTLKWLYRLAEIEQHPLDVARMALGVLKEADLAVEPLLCLSTAHVSLKTAKALGEDTLPIHRYEHGGYGWLFATSADADIGIADVPADLKDVLKYAHEMKCDWLLLDQDGTVVPSLQTYEW